MGKKDELLRRKQLHEQLDKLTEEDLKQIRLNDDWWIERNDDDKNEIK